MPIGNFLTILIFSTISFAILFFIKTRTTRVIALISSHLAIIFLFDIYLKSFANFKEIVLLISIYSMVILFLISNNKSFLIDITEENFNSSAQNIFKFHLPIAIMIIGVSITIILIATTLPSINQIINQKKSDRSTELKINPLILPSHPVHIAVKKFYLGRKFNDISNDSVSVALEKNQQKRARLKDSLAENIILKRTSDIILIIVASMTTILILANKKINQSS
jgi:hypothetical protein